MLSNPNLHTWGHITAEESSSNFVEVISKTFFFLKGVTHTV